MKILHNITYTTPSHAHNGAPYESAAGLIRGRRLTHAGAQRILRRERQNPNLVVTMIQTAVYAR